jgi:CheY-like chemotaxis protein
VTVGCPKCKGKVTLDTRGAGPEDSSQKVEENTAPEAKRGDTAKAYAAEGDALGYFEEGVKLALVAENDPDQGEKICLALEDVGYKSVAADSINQAISNMRFHRFDLVILADQFDGIELGHSPVLQYLNHLSMSIRRKMFVVLTGDKFNTMDHMMAFAMSANLVINRRDLNKLGGILKNAVSENEKFYKIFMETLTEVGRA